MNTTQIVEDPRESDHVGLFYSLGSEFFRLQNIDRAVVKVGYETVLGIIKKPIWLPTASPSWILWED